MTDIMNWLPYLLLGGLLAAVLCLLIVLLKRQREYLQEVLLDHNKTEERMLGFLDRKMDKIHQEQTDEMRRLTGEQNALWLQQMEALGKRIDLIGQHQEERLHRMAETLDGKLTQNEERMERMRETLHRSVRDMQEDNGRRLDEMRKTVDEKLHDTLDKRLGESFQLVSERLEKVAQGLGEMQTLANGVGDLKKVLTNVKSRGVWGEMQLGALLEQTLAPHQYETNAQVVPRSNQRVEYAVKLPGQQDETVYLPIDAKFPVEDYARLMDALENGSPELVQSCTAALHQALRTEGKRIASKYIAPPHTTDFAIMFLPLEGLYAEALRCSGLCEELQEKYRVVVAGPSTLTALLTSLQVGFRTLAIEKRSGEVWQLLSAVKTEFGKFTDLLDKAHRQLETVTTSIETASRKSRTITGKLKKVELLDESSAARLLSADADDEEF